MWYWTLVKTVVTQPMHIIGNADMVFVFRLELYRRSDDNSYSARVWRYFHCDVQPTASARGEIATEEIMSTEESLGIEDLRADSEADLTNKVLKQLETSYQYVHGSQ